MGYMESRMQDVIEGGLNERDRMYEEIETLKAELAETERLWRTEKEAKEKLQRAYDNIVSDMYCEICNVPFAECRC